MSTRDFSVAFPLEIGTFDLLIVDLDNTLWDWLTPWASTMQEVIRRLELICDLETDSVKRRIRQIHQKYGTSEYSWLLEEIELRKKESISEEEYLEQLASTKHFLNKQRKYATRLYPCVQETLSELQKLGVKIVGYTESQEYFAIKRIKQNGLDGVLSRLYTVRDHEEAVRKRKSRILSNNEYVLERTELLLVEDDVHKPSPEIIRREIQLNGTTKERTIYVGDHLQKDIGMANAAGVISVHSAYGKNIQLPAYELLRELSHWTDEMVLKEKEALQHEAEVPTFVLNSSFCQLIKSNFHRHGGNS